MKKGIAVLLMSCLMLLLTGCPSPYRDTLQWELKEGVLYLDDPDAPVSTDEYDIHPICYQAEWNDLRDEIKTVVIGPSIRAIGADTFCGLYNLQHVQWHDEIFYIGDYAFSDTALELESFPAKLTHIGSWAFKGCTLPEEFSIPDHITHIGDAAFASCKGIRHLISTPGVSFGMFFQCETLETVNLPYGIEKIPGKAFHECKKLKSITIPDSVTTIDHAFEYCTSLEEITLPAQIKEIERRTFLGCTALRKVELNENLKEIREQAFMDCSTLSQIHIPEHVETIGFQVFENCTSLEKFSVAEKNPHFSTDEDGILYENKGKTLLTVPPAMTGVLRVRNGIEEITSGAFKQTQLSEIILPDTVTDLQAGILEDSSATSIYLPPSVAKLHERAFSGTTKLQQILYGGNKEQWMKIENSEALNGSYILYEIPAP